jgi:hypothetical protein
VIRDCWLYIVKVKARENSKRRGLVKWLMISRILFASLAVGLQLKGTK